MRFEAELVDEPEDPPVGRERVRVRYADGATDEFRLHDYDRLYALPGLYEQIVQDRLECRSPQVMAEMLAAAVDGCGWERSQARVIDVAAGNGVSGEALAAQGLRPVLGTDLVEEARTAALRDRPMVYDEYLTLDLLALQPAQREAVAALSANVGCCVAPVGEAGVPVGVLVEVAALLAPDALVGYLHDVTLGVPDPLAAHGFERPGREIARRRYMHRRTLNGAPFEMEGVIWRLGGPP